MTPGRSGGREAELEQIRGGGLPFSSEARLRDLAAWGGHTALLSPGALGVAADRGVRPVGEVTGISVCALRSGIRRTTTPGQGRRRPDKVRWLERTGAVASWTESRRTSLGRLAQQASMLGADAVIGVSATRRESLALGQPRVQMAFTGTAVRIDGWQRDQGTRPVLTMLSASDLWCLRQAGCEPAGIAGAFLSVETQATSSTVMSGLGGRKRVPNREFKDLTASVYEARRLALERLTRDARDLDATGLLGIDLVHQHRSGGSLPGLHITVHALADAIRRVGDSRLEPGALLIQAVQRNA